MCDIFASFCGVYVILLFLFCKSIFNNLHNGSTPPNSGGFFHFFVSSSTPSADFQNCVYLIHNNHKINLIILLHFWTMCKYNPPHKTGVFYIFKDFAFCQIRGMRSTSTQPKISQSLDT